MAELKNINLITKHKKYLVFKLNNEDYSVPLSEVKEIIGLSECVQVPSSPAYFLGLINLRGAVISAIDLKLKIGLAGKKEPSKRVAVIVTEVNGVTLGCVVDSVKEVLSIDESEIDRTLEVQVQGCKEYIQGIARFKERPMILILDLKKSADITEIVNLKLVS
jgi:purine-binding chemotaxis protein CheW